MNLLKIYLEIGRFLYSCFQNYTNIDIINFLKKQGLDVKEERGNRIFPITDKSIDVLECFKKRINELKNIEIRYNESVKEIIVNQKSYDTESKNVDFNQNNVPDVIGVKTDKGTLKADKVIIATGGKSYPLTGSTGDGYKLAQKVGHTITEIKPSLVPLVCYEKELCQDLQGLSLKNVSIVIEDKEKKKVIYEDFGEMIFTHFGISGPIILSSSAHLVRYKNIDKLVKEHKIVLHLDLKPALDKQKLDDRILRDFSEFKNKKFKNSLDKLLPQKMIDTIIKLSNINPNKKVNEITKKERENLIDVLKDFKLMIKDFRPVEEAIITCRRNKY